MKELDKEQHNQVCIKSVLFKPIWLGRPYIDYEVDLLRCNLCDFEYVKYLNTSDERRRSVWNGSDTKYIGDLKKTRTAR